MLKPPRTEEEEFSRKERSAAERQPKGKSRIYRRGTEFAEFFSNFPPPRPQRLGGEQSDSSDVAFMYVIYFLLSIIFA